ncbi:MAG: 2Fe-2S iron-sulfur cluster-binding protein [Pseudomonadota bacterium]
MVSLTIDGKKVKAKEGMTILEAALENGIQIPYLCYDKDLKPYGGCRLCMVEVTENGSTRLQPSCAFPVKDNILVETETARLVSGRKLIVELLLARCPNVDTVKNLALSFGVNRTRFTESDSDCILCGKCVRVCRDVVKAQAIDFTGRGRGRYPRTPFDLPSEDCVGCGSCTYVCPTGAMKMEHEMFYAGGDFPDLYENAAICAWDSSHTRSVRTTTNAGSVKWIKGWRILQQPIPFLC